jgi:hypothetical protein
MYRCEKIRGVQPVEPWEWQTPCQLEKQQYERGKRMATLAELQREFHLDPTKHITK